MGENEAQAGLRDRIRLKEIEQIGIRVGIVGRQVTLFDMTAYTLERGRFADESRLFGGLVEGHHHYRADIVGDA